jgi:hypothetical protein
MEKHKSKFHEFKFHPCTVIKDVLLDRKFKVERILILLFAFASFSTFFYDSFRFSCGLSLFQNLILPTIIVSLAIGKMESVTLAEKLKIGVYLGAFVGLIQSTVFIFINNIQYYFFGGREFAFALRNQNPSSITPLTLYAEIGSSIVIGLLLLILSILAGLISAILSRSNIELENN